MFKGGNRKSRKDSIMHSSDIYISEFATRILDKYFVNGKVGSLYSYVVTNDVELPAKCNSYPARKVW